MQLSLRQTCHGLFGILVLLGVSACVSISSEAESVLLYRLKPLVLTAEDSAAVAPPMVLEVSSSRLLDSQRLWVMQADRRVQPLADFRWAMPAPELFRQTLIETLETAAVAIAVADSDTRLQLALRAMQIEIDAGQQAQARISVLATWSGGADGQRSSKLFEVRQEAAISSADSAAAAMDAASQQLLSELTVWIQRQSRK